MLQFVKAVVFSRDTVYVTQLKIKTASTAVEKLKIQQLEVHAIVQCRLMMIVTGARVAGTKVNSLSVTLKPHSNGSLYKNTVIGTLAVEGWAVTFGGAGRAAAPPSPVLAVPYVTAHPSTARVSTSYYSMWHYNCLWILNGSD